MYEYLKSLCLKFYKQSLYQYSAKVQIQVLQLFLNILDMDCDKAIEKKHCVFRLKGKCGRIAQPKRVVFDRSLLCLRRYNIQRGIPLVVCLRRLTRSFSVVYTVQKG